MTGIFETVPWGPLLFILLAGALPTQIFRWLGVVLAGRIRDDSEALIWVRAVATALVAGVIAQLVLDPSGALAETQLWVRVGAMIVGFAAFYLTRRQVLVGVLAGAATLLAVTALTGLGGPA
ncbi:MAG: AzlD domain-containing protein [Bauldia sp.]|nr:AzlD domain-containing protein [Bauldia sp.]